MIAADSERLPHHDFVDPGGDVFERIPLHEHGDSASHFHVFNPAPQFAFGFGEGLAILNRDEAG